MFGEVIQHLFCVRRSIPASNGIMKILAFSRFPIASHRFIIQKYIIRSWLGAGKIIQHLNIHCHIAGFISIDYGLFLELLSQQDIEASKYSLWFRNLLQA